MHQVMQMYDAEFTDAQLLNLGVSVDDTKAIAIVESGTTFVGGHFVVPLPWKKGVNSGKLCVSALEVERPEAALD
ncbi:unnamed protein product [Echinostoma caproni]|uniref:DUF2958 domain-containing protein n=1 Tax=Echinostoma caproni TaxID=27848 RepID=A0A183AX68_9TREM|nr:unnamed protein product [Echinostoma caproni]